MTTPCAYAKKRIDCKDEVRLKERLEKYHFFVAQYQAIQQQYRQSVLKGKSFHGEWPPCSYPPSICIPVGYQKDG